MGTSRLGKMIIEIENLTFNYQDKKIIENFSYNLLRNDRIGIIGNNGLGKSTLLNLIVGKLEPTTGNIKIGQTVKIGYFSQETIDMDERLRAIEYIKEIEDLSFGYASIIGNVIPRGITPIIIH